MSKKKTQQSVNIGDIPIRNINALAVVFGVDESEMRRICLLHGIHAKMREYREATGKPLDVEGLNAGKEQNPADNDATP